MSVEGGPSDSADATTFVPITVTPAERMMADTNDDGRITSVDASTLYLQAAG